MHAASVSASPIPLPSPLSLLSPSGRSVCLYKGPLDEANKAANDEGSESCVAAAYSLAMWPTDSVAARRIPPWGIAGSQAPPPCPSRARHGASTTCLVTAAASSSHLLGVPKHVRHHERRRLLHVTPSSRGTMQVRVARSPHAKPSTETLSALAPCLGDWRTRWPGSTGLPAPRVQGAQAWHEPGQQTSGPWRRHTRRRWPRVEGAWRRRWVDLARVACCRFTCMHCDPGCQRRVARHHQTGSPRTWDKWDKRRPWRYEARSQPRAVHAPVLAVRGGLPFARTGLVGAPTWAGRRDHALDPPPFSGRQGGGRRRDLARHRRRLARGCAHHGLAKMAEAEVPLGDMSFTARVPREPASKS